MNTDTKIKMRSKTRLAKGLMNILFDDLERISNELDDGNIEELKESIHDAKGTLQCVLDNLVELEYSVYLSRCTSRK